MLNPDLNQLHPYPFEQLNQLLKGINPPADLQPISLSIGEPQHAMPQVVLDALSRHIGLIAKYPTTKGTEELRLAIATWLNQRFSLNSSPINPDTQVIPVNGSREAIFAAVQAIASRSMNGLVIMPNPFYQIYEGAAFMAGLKPHYLPIDKSGQPNYRSVPNEVWASCQFCFICSPGNPSGQTIDLSTFAYLIEKAHQFDFWLASDECYSEIYRDEPPPGLLEACIHAGYDDYSRCLVFHSLSKRSNLPGLRSGFVAGDRSFIVPFLRYRTYHGCSMSIAVQKASAIAWSDESHVTANRALYKSKFEVAIEILGNQLQISDPGAGFYLWAKINGSCAIFGRNLYESTGVAVLPGQYFGRTVRGKNPGAGFVRMALVAEPEACKEALQRVSNFISR